MSVNATINAQQADGTFKQIYLHWEGDKAARTLQKCYSDPARVQALFALGDLSYLGSSLTEQGSCVSYSRDRGETGTEARVFSNMQDLVNNTFPEAYNYFYMRGRWHVTKFTFDASGECVIDPAAIKAI